MTFYRRRIVYFCFATSVVVSSSLSFVSQREPTVLFSMLSNPINIFSSRVRHFFTVQWGVYTIQQTSSKLPANVMLDVCCHML